MILRLLSAACIYLHLSSCSTLTPVRLEPGSADSALNIGAEVVLIDTSGQTQQFIVASLPPGHVCHAAGCVRVEEIATIERREFSAARTTLLVVTLVIVSVGLAYGMAMASLVGAL